MRSNIFSKISTKLICLGFLLTVAVPLLSILPAHAASPTYTWTDTTHINEYIDDPFNPFTVFHQITTDDTGRPFTGLPSDLMVLESAHTDGTSCKSGITVNPLSPDAVGMDGVRITVQDSGAAIPAHFGKGELLFVRPYVTSLTARTITFNDNNGACVDNNATTVNLTGQGTGWATWLSGTTMRYLATGEVFTEKSITGGTMILNGRTNDCGTSAITIGDDTDSYITTKTATMTVPIPSSSSQHQCTTHTTTRLTITNNFSDVAVMASWQAADPSASIRIDGVSKEAAKYISVGDLYDEPQCGGDCTGFKSPIDSAGGMTLAHALNCNGTEDNIYINPYQTARNGTLTIYSLGDTTSQHACVKHTFLVNITNSYNNPTSGNPTNPTTTVQDGCPVPNGDAFRWFSCPLYTTLDDWAKNLNDAISGLLLIPVNQFFSPSFEKVFNIFRNIGVAFLVISGLLMVISQSADLELFATHTVRKALPKIVIAAVAMALLWPLLKFAITLSNDLGNWIGNLFLSVSGTVDTNYSANFGSTLADQIGVSILTILGGVALFAFLGLGGILSLLLTVVLFIFIGSLVLAFRLLLILFAILFAPVAVAATSAPFPGADKLWGFWKDTMLTTLIMGPAIMALLALGGSTSHIAASISSDNHWFGFLAIILYVAPYILIPFMFQLIGGAIGRVASWANNAHYNGGLGGVLRGYRQRTVAANTRALAAGSRYNTDDPMGRRFGVAPIGGAVNWIGGHVGAGPRSLFGFGRRGAAGRAGQTWTTPDAASKLDPKFASFSTNQEAMAALAFGNNANALSNLGYFNGAAIYQDDHDRGGTMTRAAADTEAANRLRNALSIGSTMQASPQMQVAAAQALAQSGKLIRNRSEVALLARQVGHGNRSLETAVKEQAQYIYRAQAGRADLGRDNDLDAISELNAQTVGAQKAPSVEALFGPRPGLATPTNITGTAIVDAINNAPDPNRRQHFADLLYGLQFNASTSPEQQQWIAAAVRAVQHHPTWGTGTPDDLWANAQANYLSRVRSDIRLKTDILYLRTVKDNIRLYSFRYVWGGPTYVGVMAQDLLKTHPYVIHTAADGYYVVDYAALDIPFTTLADWQATSGASGMGSLSASTRQPMEV